MGGRQKACLLTRKLVVFLQLPYFVQLCGAAGAQQGCLQRTRDPAQPELKFQKKGEETNRPLTMFKRYILLLFPACLFDQTKPFFPPWSPSLLFVWSSWFCCIESLLYLCPALLSLIHHQLIFFFFLLISALSIPKAARHFFLERLIDERKQKWNF